MAEITREDAQYKPSMIKELTRNIAMEKETVNDAHGKPSMKKEQTWEIGVEKKDGAKEQAEEFVRKLQNISRIKLTMQRPITVGRRCCRGKCEMWLFSQGLIYEVEMTESGERRHDYHVDVVMRCLAYGIVQEWASYGAEVVAEGLFFPYVII